MLNATVLLIASLATAEAPEPPSAAAAPRVPASSPASDPPPFAAGAVPAVRTDELVKLIAREALAQQAVQKALEAAEAKPDNFGVLSAHPKNDPYAVFAIKFAEARTPSCLGPDGLKLNPPVLFEIRDFGPFALSGLLATPWVVGAKLTGKCN